MMQIKNIKNVILILILINTFFTVSNEVVFAMEPAVDDMIIYVKNCGEKVYYLDIITEENNEYYSSFSDSVSKDLKNSKLYKYRDGNCMAHFIRGGTRDFSTVYSFIGGETAEKDVKRHCFSDSFINGLSMKVILQTPNNDLIISNPIVFDPQKAYIFNTKTKRLEVINRYYLMIIERAFPVMAVLFSVIFALIMKLLTSFTFGISQKWYVVFIGTINQVMLYFVVYLLIINRIFDWVSVTFTSSMIILAAGEFLAYRRILKDTISLRKTLSFVAVSNALIIPFGWIFLEIL